MTTAAPGASTRAWPPVSVSLATDRALDHVDRALLGGPSSMGNLEPAGAAHA